MWIRFETRYRNPNSRWAAGVFQYFSTIVKDMEVDRETRIRVQKLREWFNRHLPAPPVVVIDRKSIFWFKCKPDLAKPIKVSPWKRRPLTKLAARVPKSTIPSDRAIDEPRAAEAIKQLKELVKLMDRAGYETRVITTQRPGYIVYEDSFQIAAIPFKDAIDEHYLEDWLEE